ncbi:MAG: FHA domain-containing protein [Planctomycetia bacterium]|nr:FHA domain-containing protein [Planctomycetia bacterium]
MKISLIVTQGSNKGKGIPVSKSEFCIGRDPKCHLRPASQAVSKRHCLIHIRDDQIFVEDLKSTNGTFVNEDQVQGERELKDGDLLKVGPLEFVVKTDSVHAQADKPTHVEKETRAPAAPAKAAPAKSAPSKGEPVDEEAIASMLLGLSDDEHADGGDGNGDDYAGGSTVMQVLKPEELEQLQAATEKAPYRPASNKPSATGTTSNAAKAILEKYRKRPKA